MSTASAAGNWLAWRKMPDPESHYKRHVDLPRQELFGGCAWLQGQQFADLLLNPRTFQQFERQRSRPAAFWPNRDLSTSQAIESHTLELAPVEPPHGLVEDRPKRFDS